MYFRKFAACRFLFVGFPRNNNIKLIQQQYNRHGHIVSYRSPPPAASKATRIGAEVVAAAMWWWILWHLWHESEHITGEFAYPNASKWTNSELGIPKDEN